MSKQTNQIQQPRRHRLSVQPKEEKERNNRAPVQSLEGLTPGAALRLPGRASQSLRQAAVIQMQATFTNSAMSMFLEEGDSAGGPFVPTPFPNKADMGGGDGLSSKVKFMGSKQTQAPDTTNKALLIATDIPDSQKEEDQ